MLVYTQNNTWIEWNKRDQRPNAQDGNKLYWLPQNAEEFLSNAELLNYGLYRVDPPDPVPDDVTITGYRIDTVNFKPKQVYEYTVNPPKGPSDFPLTARQLRIGMIRNNVSLTQVQNIINGIPNEKTKDEYQVYWEYSTTVNWSHPITQSLIAAVGLSQSNAAIMWMIAKDYEA